MSLVPSFIDLLQPLSCVMTAPSFDNFLTLVTGWAFSRRRTVTAMIIAADAVGEKHHSAYHRLFAAACWSLDELGLAVFALILMLVNGVVLKLPFCGDRWFCLPVLFRLYVPRKTADKKKLAYQTKPQLAVEMLTLLCGRFAHRRFHAVGDSAYGGKSVLLELPDNCDLTSRLTMDARLYDAPVSRKGRKGGRPRKRGNRLPTPQAMLAGRCRHLALDIYGRKDKGRVSECIARVYAAPDRPLKVIAVEPLSGGRRPQAFYSTCPDDTAEGVLTRYACRWSIEVMNHDVKGHLGFEEPQGWTRQAVNRTAPVAMLLYSLVVLWFARTGHRHYKPPYRPWYTGKTQASFADMLATLRCQSVRHEVLSMGLHGRGSRNIVKALLHAVKQAA